MRRGLFVLAITSCTEAQPNPTPDEASALELRRSAVGLALEVEDGAGVPLELRRGQKYFLAQLDLRAAIAATVDEGVDGLAERGDFADLSWDGTRLEDQEWVLIPNPDGTYRRRRFYRGAAWMEAASEFRLEQLDDGGRVLGRPIEVQIARDAPDGADDGFFGRRLRAIQWTDNCRSTTDCTGATMFQEEALVELRYPNDSERTTFALHGATTTLRLRWSLRPDHPYTIPVTQIASPTLAYGFAIDVDALTPPRVDGTYAAGSDITFRLTLRDGRGERLHPEGSLPTYADVIFGADSSGIQYYRAFFDPTTTYWRRKHRERMLIGELIGPVQNTRPIRSIAPLEIFLGPDDVQVTATLARDGIYSEMRTFPTAHDLFGGAFDPEHAAWHAPVPDTWTHHIPADAPPGTYLVSVKGRRVYMGEDVPFARTVPIQVGVVAPTLPTFDTGGCESCHNGSSGLGQVLHANDNRATCAGCHVPLSFELEGPIYVRTHYIHSRSQRYAAPLDNCASCHLSTESIARTSKSACLSCHRSYDSWHVEEYGPIQSSYVGGGPESFEQCTSRCHTTHPRSGL